MILNLTLYIVFPETGITLLLCDIGNSLGKEEVCVCTCLAIFSFVKACTPAHLPIIILWSTSMRNLWRSTQRAETKQIDLMSAVEL